MTIKKAKNKTKTEKKGKEKKKGKLVPDLKVLKYCAIQYSTFLNSCI
jgi:hypothetical protein